MRANDGGKGSEERAGQRLRGPRYRPLDFSFGQLDARVELREGQPEHAEVLDFSGDGAALRLSPGMLAPAAGAIVRSLRIAHEDSVFFDGQATIRHGGSADRRLVGLEFIGPRLDLRGVHDLDLRHGLRERLAQFYSGFSELPAIEPRFKAWVSDVRYFLDRLRLHLRAEELRFQDHDQLTREAAIEQAIELAQAPLRSFLDAKFAELSAITAEFDALREDQHRTYLQHHLLDRFTAESTFFGRAHAKPLGYAGDYELMNMIYGRRYLGTTLYGRALSSYVCNSTASCAVRNRVPYLARRVAELTRDRPAARVTSLACGPAHEMLEIIDASSEVQGQTWTLMDVEPRALHYCEKVVLPRVQASGRDVRIRLVRESVRRLLLGERLEDMLPSQDLIVSVGLFDYFGDRTFRHLLERLYRLLRPGGHLLIGNFDPRNDTKTMMDYVMEWRLHHRSPSELRLLCEGLPQDASAALEAEPLGVNSFVHVTRPLTAARAMDVMVPARSHWSAPPAPGGSG